MIEIRPSDVAEAQLENRNKVFDILGMVIGKVAEAEKVNQVNNGLTALMRSEALWQNQERTQLYDRQPEYGGGSGQDVGEVKQIDFGHATEFEVKAKHDKFIKEQREFILSTATHPGAKRELAFHLDQQAVTSYQRTRQDWRETRQRVAVADLKVLSGEIMKSGLSWDQKAAAFKSRVDPMVAAMDIYPDVGATYIQEFTEQAQDMDAFAGSLNAMTTAGTEKAGIDWLDKKTPYFTPEKREEAKGIIISKFAVIAKQNDDALDVKYGDLYLKADLSRNIADVNTALAELKADHYYNGNQKITQTMRFEALKERLESNGLSPAEARSAREDAYELRERVYSGKVASWKYDHPGDVTGLKKILDGGLAKNDIRGDYYQVQLDKLGILQTPGYRAGMESLKGRISKFPEVDQLRMIFEFDKYMSDPQTGRSDQDILSAVANIVNKKLVDVGNKYLLRFTEGVSAGSQKGVTERNLPQLESNAALAFKQASIDYPVERLKYAFVDVEGTYSNGQAPGASIFMNWNDQPYGYRVVDGQLVLYRLQKTTGDVGQIKGKIGYDWIPLTKKVTPERTSEAAPPLPEGFAEPVKGVSRDTAAYGTITLSEWKKEGGRWTRIADKAKADRNVSAILEELAAGK